MLSGVLACTVNSDTIQGVGPSLGYRLDGSTVMNSAVRDGKKTRQASTEKGTLQLCLKGG